MNGDKKTEVRRGTALYNAINKLTKEQGKAPCLIYCTMGKPYLVKHCLDGKHHAGNCLGTYDGASDNEPLNGKVIAEFEASAEIISLEEQGDDDFGCNPWFYETPTLDQDELVKLSCLDLEGFDEYLDGKDGTAIHVKQGTMSVFDRPKDLYEFKCPKPLRYSNGKEGKILFPITRAPQSWCYVEMEE